MNAKLAFTAISEIPLPGSRAAAISCCREAATNAPAEPIPTARQTQADASDEATERTPVGSVLMVFQAARRLHPPGRHHRIVQTGIGL
jgi:hypothetical protein